MRKWMKKITSLTLGLGLQVLLSTDDIDSFSSDEALSKDSYPRPIQHGVLARIL